ncbi:type II toxin-antitoxin system HicA family toxin [Propionimicrobium sp. PCR01-08-3]|uniref:type II toxin-antitoxin system HicA family toxin n=1 Tax=Propionimicrobium sp. PCR01-08-3 TaxID=3052086 RepID=UPI00255C61B1|nr:type II toxin-antitoxin system HicA family toxin [Propionimicrobium sp. PCR01-08-3]WIY82836.1 type II toxin-antitoxin system HicA family toxin [Propionimicrobium sp. PCR01-08-3]
MKPQKYRDVTAVLTGQGWVWLRNAAGSHEIWGSPDGKTKLVVPHHREVTAGVLRKIAAKLDEVPDSWK